MAEAVMALEAVSAYQTAPLAAREIMEATAAAAAEAAQEVEVTVQEAAALVGLVGVGPAAVAKAVEAWVAVAEVEVATGTSD